MTYTSYQSHHILHIFVKNTAYHITTGYHVMDMA